MSDTNFEKLTPDRLSLQDSSGVLDDSPVRRTSPMAYLIVDGYGGYPTMQITDIVVNGLTLAQTAHGRLFCTIYDDGDGPLLKLTRMHTADDYYLPTEHDISMAVFEGGAPQTADLIEQNSSGVNGTVTISSVEPDDTLEILIPLSSVVPLLAEDPFYNISSMELHGVTRDNSVNGVLNWTYADDRLTLLNDSTPVAQGTVVPPTAYPPYACEIEAVDGSGITGSVVLEGFEPSDGRLIIKVTDGVQVDGKVVVESDVVVEGLKDLGAAPERAIGVNPQGKIILLS